MSTPERRALRKQAQAQKDAGDARPWQHIYAELLMNRGMALDDKVNVPDEPPYELEVFRLGVRWVWRLVDTVGVVVARPETGRTWDTAPSTVTAARLIFPDLTAEVIA